MSKLVKRLWSALGWKEELDDDEKELQSDKQRDDD